MKVLTKAIALALAAMMLLTACSSGQGGDSTTAPLTDEQILEQRRDAVEAQMRKMATVLWRSTEDITYTKTAGDDAELRIVAGRVYQGLPYTQAGGTELGFLDFAASKDEKGIYTISGLNKEMLHSGSGLCRISNDCSSAVLLSWGMVGNSVTSTSTKTMVPDRGCIRVGEYESDPSVNNNTKDTIRQNDEQTMYKAYAQLQKGDAVVYNHNGAGHAMMAVKVIVYEKDGVINGDASLVLLIDQTSSYMRQEKIVYNETIGENVYQIYGLDKGVSFKSLYNTGYLPVTCKELIDPSPVEEMKVTDSESTYTKDNIFKGVFSANRHVGDVTITIKDASGNVVQKVTGYVKRSDWRNYDLNNFLTEDPKVLNGSVDLSKLAAGTYHCTHVCRLADGTEFTMRDFDFTV